MKTRLPRCTRLGASPVEAYQTDWVGQSRPAPRAPKSIIPNNMRDSSRLAGMTENRFTWIWVLAEQRLKLIQMDSGDRDKLSECQFCVSRPQFISQLSDTPASRFDFFRFDQCSRHDASLSLVRTGSMVAIPRPAPALSGPRLFSPHGGHE